MPETKINLDPIIEWEFAGHTKRHMSSMQSAYHPIPVIGDRVRFYKVSGVGEELYRVTDRVFSIPSEYSGAESAMKITIYCKPE